MGNRAVRHPNVVAVHDVLSAGDLVMEYRGAPTLAALLHGGRSLAPPVVAALGRQLLTALEAVHAVGVVHCDVKPANVLVDRGCPVLIDFGIAEAAGAGPAHPARRNGYIVGSPAYMAPELVRGEPPLPASDLWSLGATLYAAVEGRLPFPHDDAVAGLRAVLHAPPVPTRKAGRLQRVLARLLAKHPGERPSHEAVDAMLAEACAPGDGHVAALAVAPERTTGWPQLSGCGQR